MGDLYDIGKARRIMKRPPPFAMPESLLVIAETFGFDIPHAFDRFHLRRCKEGTQVFIKGGRLVLNISYYEKVYPENFKAARKWIASVAARYGWQIVETKQYF